MVSVSHTLREGSQCADFLVKLGASQEDHFRVFDSPPSGLSTALLADTTGVVLKGVILFFLLFSLLLSSLYQKKRPSISLFHVSQQD